MNETDKLLLKQKLEQNKIQHQNKEIENQKKQIIENVEDFNRKYRFADNSETEKLQNFTDKLNFTSPAHISAEKSKNTNHNNAYLCFLCGSKELLNIYIYGKYNDIINDMYEWDFFSPYLLIVDEDFSRYVYINDNQEISEHKIKT
ncbi:MAG: hypothetical protein IJA12_00195 [Oscillospiraceae bacterium]|nr:hypothetical protein [Oscillospiraceae bacterium]